MTGGEVGNRKTLSLTRPSSWIKAYLALSYSFLLILPSQLPSMGSFCSSSSWSIHSFIWLSLIRNSVKYFLRNLPLEGLFLSFHSPPSIVVISLRTSYFNHPPPFHLLNASPAFLGLFCFVNILFPNWCHLIGFPPRHPSRGIPLSSLLGEAEIGGCQRTKLEGEGMEEKLGETIVFRYSAKIPS